MKIVPTKPVGQLELTKQMNMKCNIYRGIKCVRSDILVGHNGLEVTVRTAWVGHTG